MWQTIDKLPNQSKVIETDILVEKPIGPFRALKRISIWGDGYEVKILMEGETISFYFAFKFSFNDTSITFEVVKEGIGIHH